MINLRKKHQSQLMVPEQVLSQPVQAERMPSRKGEIKPKRQPRTNRSSGNTRVSPTSVPVADERPIPVEHASPARSDGDGSIGLGLAVIAIVVGIWLWNRNDTDQPAPPAPVPVSENQSSGQGPGWWSAAPVRIDQEDQFAESLRDALVSSLDRNGDGVIDAEEIIEGSEPLE